MIDMLGDGGGGGGGGVNYPELLPFKQWRFMKNGLCIYHMTTNMYIFAHEYLWRYSF